MSPSFFAAAFARLAGLAALAAVAAGCDPSPSVGDRPLVARTRQPAPPPRADDTDAEPAVATEVIDPAPPPGDLKSEIDGFTTLDGCVKTHARLDPLVGDAIEALGYDTLLRDACSIVEAAKALDVRRCAVIEVSSLRERCVATVAEVAGKADACPWEMPGRPLRGRDPACLAIAARDARLCAAVVQASEREACVAVAAGEPAACNKLPREADRARCARAAARWRTLLTIAAPRPRLAVTGKLHLEAAGETPFDSDFAEELERGLVVEEQNAGLRLRVGSALGSGMDDLDRDKVVVELVVPPVDPAQATPPAPAVRVERLDAIVRGHRVTLVSPARATGITVKVTSLERARGSRVELSIAGVFGDGPSAANAHVELQTFVRDVVRPADVYSMPLHLGLDAGIVEP
jgi:hypothetical protein